MGCRKDQKRTRAGSRCIERSRVVVSEAILRGNSATWPKGNSRVFAAGMVLCRGVNLDEDQCSAVPLRYRGASKEITAHGVPLCRTAACGLGTAQSGGLQVTDGNA